MTTTIFYLKFKENNKNDMAAHGNCFDFYYRPNLRQTGQNGCQVFVDARLAGHTLPHNLTYSMGDHYLAFVGQMRETTRCRWR